MKKYFNFNGTTKRQEYWAVYVISMVALILSIIVTELGALGAVIALAMIVAALWAVIATTVRRLRDAGLSLWWVLATLVPYIGTVATIVFGCIGSKEE